MNQDGGNCICCGQLRDRKLQQGLAGRPDIPLETCHNIGCPLNGYTLNPIRLDNWNYMKKYIKETE